MEDLIKFITAIFEFIWFLIKAHYDVICGHGVFNGILGAILLYFFYGYIWCFIKFLIAGVKHVKSLEKNEDENNDHDGYDDHTDLYYNRCSRNRWW